MTKEQLSRRFFLKAATGAVLFPQIIPSSALGLDGNVAPSNRIAMGFVGPNGRGTGGLGAFMATPNTTILASRTRRQSHHISLADPTNGPTYSSTL